MSTPRTYNEVMAWFGTGHHAGTHDLHGLSLLLSNASITSPENIWDWVLSQRLLVRGSNEFWITPRGKVWNVSWAMHEFLVVYPMEELDVHRIELAGWLRVSKSSALAYTKPTRIQLDTLAKLRPDLSPRPPFGEYARRKKYPESEVFDVPEPTMSWTVWLPEFDAKPE